MSNGPLRNCALGICCPPPLQQKALAVTIMQIAEEDKSVRAESDWRELFLAIAGGLMDRGMIGTTPEDAAHLKQEASPTEEELDRMLEG